MINNQINRRIGSCEEHLFLSLSPPLFFVRNWKKEEKKRGEQRGFQLGDSEGEKRKTDTRRGTSFEEEERRIEYSPSFSTSRFGDSRLIYNSISICSKRRFEKKTNTASLGFLDRVDFFFFFFSFKRDSLEITMMFNYRLYGGYILARMYATSFISVILITKDCRGKSR